MYLYCQIPSYDARRAPHGARGLKSAGFEPVVYVLCMSRPAWGAWIEMIRPRLEPGRMWSRAPHGARGLK